MKRKGTLPAESWKKTRGQRKQLPHRIKIERNERGNKRGGMHDTKEWA